MPPHASRSAGRVLAAAVAAVAAASCLVALATSAPAVGPTARVDPRVAAAAARDGSARVIVLLHDVAPLVADDGEREALVERRQDELLARTDGETFHVTRRFDYVAALAGIVTPAGIAQLARDPAVESIELDAVNVPFLSEVVPVVRANVVRSAHGLTGEGVNVAVLDTGIDPRHPDLADDIVAQHCFSSNGGCVPNNSTESDDAQDENGHGTGVSGIITAKGEASPAGVAPDAGIVAVRVFDDKARAQNSDIVAGLEWIRRNRRELQVKVVNMSLGSTEVYGGNCDSSDEARARVISQLNALGIAVFAASGNGGSTNGMSSPACISNVISVGATYDARLGRQPPQGMWGAGCVDEFTSPDTIACFTNIGRTLSMVAPGAMVTHPRLGGGTDTTAGTSDASPVAAAVAALLFQADPELRPKDLERLLQSTGTMVKHPRANLSFPRIDAARAVESLLGITPAPGTPTATAEATPTPTLPSPSATPVATTAVPTATAPIQWPSDTPTVPGSTVVWPTDTPTVPGPTVVWPTDTPGVSPRRDVYLPALLKRP